MAKAKDTTAKPAVTKDAGRDLQERRAADIDIAQAVLAATFRNVDELIPYARNARTHSDKQVDQIAASIVEFGFTNPVLADAQGIVAGHGRVMGAKKVYASGQLIALPNGVTIPPGTVPVLDCTGWSEAKRKAYILADNQIALNAGWDENLLALEIEDLKGFDYDIGTIGFESAFIEGLGKGAVKAGLTDPDETPAVPPEPVSRHGDVWVCGDHRIMCGDSRVPAEFERLLAGVIPDLANCDPPYGISIVKGAGKVGGAKAFGSVGGNGNRETLDNPEQRGGRVHGRGQSGFGKVHGPAKNAIIEPNVYAPIIGDDTTETAIRAHQVLVDLGVPAIVLWGGNYYANAMPASRCWLVWDKENSGTFADCELAWTNRDAVARLFRHQWNGLIKASERGERRVHPTQKPVALADWVIDVVAPEAKTVVDLFLGSGWTLISAERKGVALFGMELAPAYVDVAVTRWERFTGRAAVLEGDGRRFAEVLAERCPAGQIVARAGKKRGGRAAGGDSGPAEAASAPKRGR